MATKAHVKKVTFFTRSLTRFVKIKTPFHTPTQCSALAVGSLRPLTSMHPNIGTVSKNKR